MNQIIIKAYILIIIIANFPSIIIIDVTLLVLLTVEFEVVCLSQQHFILSASGVSKFSVFSPYLLP